MLVFAVEISGSSAFMEQIGFESHWLKIIESYVLPIQERVLTTYKPPVRSVCYGFIYLGLFPNFWCSVYRVGLH